MDQKGTHHFIDHNYLCGFIQCPANSCASNKDRNYDDDKLNDVVPTMKFECGDYKSSWKLLKAFSSLNPGGQSHILCYWDAFSLNMSFLSSLEKQHLLTATSIDQGFNSVTSVFSFNLHARTFALSNPEYHRSSKKKLSKALKAGVFHNKLNNGHV